MGAFSIWHALILIAIVPLFKLIVLWSFAGRSFRRKREATRRAALSLGRKLLDRQGAAL